jgi:hypothetical protein
MAEALHRELGGDTGLAFLDTSDLETLQKFPAEISDALLAAKVVVVFADETYFKRSYCLREFETALAPFQALVRRNSPSEEKEKALFHFVIAMPEADVSRQLTDRLPPSLRLTQWPRASDTKRLAEVVRKRLEGVTRSLEEDLIFILGESEAERVGKRFREQAALPSPASLRGMRLSPTEMPASLDEGFKGRADDLWRLHHELSSVATGDAPRSVAIEGGGGFGKTRLALEYFDNIPETELSDPPKGLEEWCPGAGMVTVLSTSRKIASSQGANVHPLNLDVLPPEAAVDLLTYRNQRAGTGRKERPKRPGRFRSKRWGSPRNAWALKTLAHSPR